MLILSFESDGKITGRQVFFTAVPSKISLARAPEITHRPSRLNYASESPAGMTF